MSVYRLGLCSWATLTGKIARICELEEVMADLEADMQVSPKLWLLLSVAQHAVHEDFRCSL